jgi:sugar phosphate isomerase/epimerase
VARPDGRRSGTSQSTATRCSNEIHYGTICPSASLAHRLVSGFDPEFVGVIDFSLVFETLDALGYDGWVVIEDFSGARPSRETLEHNLQFVQSLVKPS